MEPIGHLEAYISEPGSVVLTLTDRPFSGPAYLRRPRTEAAGPTRWLGTITVRSEQTDDADHRAMPDQVNEVCVELAGGITATALQRLPWARLLAAADAHLRAQSINTVEAWREAARERNEAISHTGESPRWQAPPRKRGRPAKDPGELMAVAERYLELCRQGVPNPVQCIANEEHCNRNTAAGWIRKARALGMLAPARRGKPG